MEHQTPSSFPGNFRKRKVLGTLSLPRESADNRADGRSGHLVGSSPGFVFELSLRCYEKRKADMASGSRGQREFFLFLNARAARS